MIVSKPDEGIPPIEKVPEGENHIWAKKVKNVHDWCLRRMSERGGPLLSRYLDLIREWFPHAIPAVYRSPYEGSSPEVGVGAFFPVITFYLKFSFPRVCP